MIKKIDNRIVYIDKEIKGYVEFIINGNIVTITHTYVDESLRGKGIASKLMEYTYNYFKNYEIKSTCEYASNWLTKNL